MLSFGTIECLQVLELECINIGLVDELSKSKEDEGKRGVIELVSGSVLI